MSSRIVCLVLAGLLALVQVQMWRGRGSIPDVTALQHKLDLQRAANTRAKLANDQLASEVTDLKAGLGAVEEKARMNWAWSSPTKFLCRWSGKPARTALPRFCPTAVF
jgi:cell division protein FtsB